MKNERKEELKDEMKNRISLALKDPILQQGFEIICKELEELEKSCEETQKLLDKQIEATYKLDKENAELKEQISTKDILIEELQKQKVYWKESSFDWRHKFFKKGSTKRLVQKDKQLTKAKELLAKWVESFKPKLEGFPKTPIQVDTEQFLNGEGCPDCFCEDCTKEDCGIKKLGLVEVEK